MEKSKEFIKKGAVGYIRCHAKETKNSYGVVEQEKAIRSYVSENEYRLLEIFTDKNKSGKTFERSGLQALLKYIEGNNRVKFLIVSDVSRLSTNTDGLKSLKRFLKDSWVKLISLVYLMPKGSKDNGEKPKQLS
ncbi:MAG TPA: recombinase family protein [Candidatus Paceibacterota bacterium]